MRIKGDYIVDFIGDEQMAIPLSASQQQQAGIAKLNGTGAFLWERLQHGTSEKELVEALLEEYEVKQEQAVQDVRNFLELLRSRNLLEE